MRSALPIALLLLVACGGSQAASSGTTAAAEPAGSPGEQLSLTDQMWRHFHDATEALDAVIGGNLEAVRVPMRRLAEREYGEEVPDDWMPWVAEMQAEARRGAESADLDTAAKSVAALGTTCGECHRATRGGAEFTGDEAGYRHLRNTGLNEKMARHLWSAKELWLGLTGPVHQAWSRGAAALMNVDVPALVDHRGVPATTDEPPTGEGKLAGESGKSEAREVPSGSAPSTTASGAVDLDAAFRDLRVLGERADTATIAKEKEQVFGEIVSRCAGCHAELGIEPAPTRHE